MFNVFCRCQAEDRWCLQIERRAGGFWSAGDSRDLFEPGFSGVKMAVMMDVDRMTASGRRSTNKAVADPYGASDS